MKPRKTTASARRSKVKPLPHEPPDDNDLLNPEQAAEFLRSRERSLERWRTVGGGPPFVRLGRYVHYRRGALVAWLLQQERTTPAGALQLVDGGQGKADVRFALVKMAGPLYAEKGDTHGQ